MSSKTKKIYKALVDGATDGKSGKALYDHVKQKCPKSTSRRIVKASLKALTDPDVKDANILRVIYALAIVHRLDPVEDRDLETDDDEVEEALPSAGQNETASVQ
jgi:hypothetical protein